MFYPSFSSSADSSGKDEELRIYTFNLVSKKYGIIGNYLEVKLRINQHEFMKRLANDS